MSKLPDPIRTLSERIRKIEEQLRRLGNSSPYFGTGMHPNGDGGIDSDNFQAGSAGYSFKSDGNAEFNDITLRGGIIGNAALTDPVAVAVVHADATNFSLTSGPNVSKATATVPVPSGYTRAMVSATASVTGYNDSASDDFIYAVAYIQSDTTRGWAMNQSVAPGESGFATQTATTLLTGLSGSFTIKVATSTGYNTWSAIGSNVANIDATVMFLR